MKAVVFSIFGAFLIVALAYILHINETVNSNGWFVFLAMLGLYGLCDRYFDVLNMLLKK